jgi:hypothetical protein
MHPSATLTGPKATALAWPEVLTVCSGALTVPLLEKPTNTAARIAAALAVIITSRFITTLLFFILFAMRNTVRHRAYWILNGTVQEVTLELLHQRLLGAIIC